MNRNKKINRKKLVNLEVEVTLGNNVNHEKDANLKCVVNHNDWVTQETEVNQSYW